MRLAAQADAPGACGTVLAAPPASTGEVYGAAAWLWPGSPGLAVCRHELRSRPVILRNAWSEPKENKVDPGRHCAGSGQTVRGHADTGEPQSPPGEVRKGLAPCQETTGYA